MSNVLRCNFRIDRKFFSLKKSSPSRVTHHLEWADDTRLSLRRVEGARKRSAPVDYDKKAVCDEIVRIAEMEVGPL
jgi:hypothetical protein